MGGKESDRKLSSKRSGVCTLDSRKKKKRREKRNEEESGGSRRLAAMKEEKGKRQSLCWNTIRRGKKRRNISFRNWGEKRGKGQKPGRKRKQKG